jgi:hypothetical protein
VGVAPFPSRRLSLLPGRKKNRGVGQSAFEELYGALIKYAIRVMGYRLTAKSLKAAIRHLCRYGDTDIFPRLPELAFFADEERHIITELSKLDLDSSSQVPVPSLTAF